MNKTFTTGGNEAKLIEHKAANGIVSGIFWNRDSVLSIEIANIQSSVENDSTVG